MNDKELIVFGHVFESWSPGSFRIDRRGFKHAWSVLRMFTISPLANARISLHFKDVTVETKTLDDGYFRFTIPFSSDVEPGWHQYTISYAFQDFGIVERGELLKPFESKYGIISDIDDTFLISHSNNFFMKLFVLLSKNINKRKIFSDVAAHYRALSLYGHDNAIASNSFFYVSSSEWNLYGFIDEFIKLHKLPKAVIKLKKIKTGISDFLFTGRGGHDHKFEKIKDIISFYPTLKYVLFGDDTQQDPYLYERVCKVFPQNITVVYIRQTSKHKKSKVIETLQNIEDLSVRTLYYSHSSEAMDHSREIGIL